MALMAEFSGIVDSLKRLAGQKHISELEVVTIADMTRKVVRHLAKNTQNVSKGLGDVMGGQVLEYEAKTIFKNGIEQGRAEGRAEGRTIGRAEGRTIGRAEGIMEGKEDMIRELYAEGLLSRKDASDKLGISEREFEQQFAH